MYNMCISQSNSWLLFSILLLPCLFPYGQRCSDTNDGLFERRVVSVCNTYLHILYMIEPGKDIRFSSSLKHLHNVHLSGRSPQIHLRWTIDGRSKYNKVQARDDSVQQYIIHKVPRALPASYVQQRAHSTTEDRLK